MRDYKQGKIYKIVSYQTDRVYIGSTIETLSRRMSGHRAGYKRHQAGKSNYLTSFDILAFGDAEIVLIEVFPCESKGELEARERHWIEQTSCVNKRIPTRTQKEYNQGVNRENRREYSQRYAKDNQDHSREQKRQYRQANQEHISDYLKRWYQANREKAMEDSR